MWEITHPKNALDNLILKIWGAQERNNAQKTSYPLRKRTKMFKLLIKRNAIIKYARL